MEILVYQVRQEQRNNLFQLLMNSSFWTRSVSATGSKALQTLWILHYAEIHGSAKHRHLCQGPVVYFGIN